MINIIEILMLKILFIQILCSYKDIQFLIRYDCETMPHIKGKNL